MISLWCFFIACQLQSIFCHYIEKSWQDIQKLTGLYRHAGEKSVPKFICWMNLFIFVFILQVLDCLTALMEQMEMYKTKEHGFEMKLKEEAHTQRKMLDETQKFRARLQECQVLVGGNIDCAM